MSNYGHVQITRSRRWGKTLNMDMLNVFLSPLEDKTRKIQKIKSFFNACRLKSNDAINIDTNELVNYILFIANYSKYFFDVNDMVIKKVLKK